MKGDRIAWGHEARQLSPRLNINKAEPSVYFVSHAMVTVALKL